MGVQSSVANESKVADLEENRAAVVHLLSVRSSIGAGDSCHAHHPHPDLRSDLLSSTIHRLKRIPCAGILMGLMAGIVSSIAAFIVKLIPNVNPIQIVVVRSFIQLLFYLPFVFKRRQSLAGVAGERMFLMVRGFIGFMAFTLSYVAVRMMPLGDVATIVFSAPIYVSIFACICLSESCGVFQVLTIGMTITGTLMIAKPTFLFARESGAGAETDDQVHLRTEGTIAAFAASLLVSLTFIVMRKLRRTSTPVIISVFSAECVIFGSLLLVILHVWFQEEAGVFAQGIGVPDTWSEILLLCCNGFCGVLGLLCMTIGMKIEEAGLMSLVRSIDIVCAFVLQVLYLPDEVVHWTSLLGAAIVVTSLVVSGLRRYLKDKPDSCPRLWAILTCGEERKEKDVLFLQTSVKPGSSMDQNANHDLPPVVS